MPRSSRAPQKFVEPRSQPVSPSGDYNGRDRGGEDGVVIVAADHHRDGKRSSTYHAFLEGEREERAEPRQ